MIYAKKCDSRQAIFTIVNLSLRAFLPAQRRKRPGYDHDPPSLGRLGTMWNIFATFFISTLCKISNEQLAYSDWASFVDRDEGVSQNVIVCPSEISQSNASGKSYCILNPFLQHL